MKTKTLFFSSLIAAAMSTVPASAEAMVADGEANGSAAMSAPAPQGAVVEAVHEAEVAPVAAFTDGAVAETGGAPVSVGSSVGGEQAKRNNSGAFGIGEDLRVPAAFRSLKDPVWEARKDSFLAWQDSILSRVDKVMTPEMEERLKKQRKARDEAHRLSYEASMAGRHIDVVYAAKAPAHLAEIAFAWDKKGYEIDKIPNRVLREATTYYMETFGVSSEDIVRMGYESPFDFGRKIIKSAVDIVRTEERRQEAWAKMSHAEQEEKANKAVFGDDTSKWKAWSYDDLKRFSESESLSGLADAAFASGADSRTVLTAIMIALDEHMDEDIHRIRLAQLEPDQMRMAYNLAMAIRAQYDGNVFGKFFISFANGIESVKDNIIQYFDTDRAFLKTKRDFELDALSQSLEDTLIDTSTFGGKLATVLGSSAPLMLLAGVGALALVVARRRRRAK